MSLIAKGFLVLSIPKSGLFMKDGELVAGDGERVSSDSDKAYVTMFPSREAAERRSKELREKFERSMSMNDPLILEVECTIYEPTE